MRNLNLKVKDKFLIFMLPFIVVTLLAVSFLVYHQAKQFFTAGYNQQKAQIEANIVNSMHAIDSGFAMFEKNMEKDMTQKILTFRDEFEKAGDDPDKISLDELKSRFGEEYDLFIIDRNTTIIKSTVSELLNVNFSETSKTLGDIINRIRAVDSLHFERFDIDWAGSLSMYAYIPSSDQQYLLQVAYTRPDFSSYVSELKPVSITSKQKKVNPEIESIRVFDVFGRELVKDGPNKTETKESMAIVERAGNERHFEIWDGNIIKSYLYIDLKREGNILRDNSKIVEIEYDTTTYANELNKIFLVCLLVSSVVIISIVFFIFFLTNKMTRPITTLANAARKIAGGDYSVSAEKFSQDEIGELTDIFNSMTAKIREDFEKIEHQKQELENYNRNLEEMVDTRTRELIRARETIKREKDVLESILDDTLSGYWDFDLKRSILYFSSGFKKMLGYEDYELGNNYKDISGLTFPEDAARTSERFRKHVESRGMVPFYNEVRCRHKDGTVLWVIFAGHVIEWGSDNAPLQMIGCTINITNLKALEQSLNDERSLLKATLLSMGDGVITTDKDGNIKIVNAVAEKLTGWTQEEAAGMPFEKVFSLVDKSQEKLYKNPLDRALRSGEMVQEQDQMVLLAKSGVELPIEDSAAPIRDENGTISGAVIVFRDFTEKKEKQERIEYLSLHDQLTGLYSRRFFEEELKRLDTSRNLPLAIIMLDVNGLKLINDAFGHAMGDLTLQRAAAIMKEECRCDDIIARFGGDEFVILLPQTGQEEAELLVKRIYTALETEIIDHINVSVSCGWAVKQDRSENIANIFKLAEDHMYRRKLSESRSMHYKTIDTILKTLHGKSAREKLHSERVGELCESIAAALELDPEDVKEFRAIGMMHDIGKIAIDLSILDKPGSLDKMERAEIERHPELGYQLLRSINDFAKLAEYTLSHHERWDGTGYPRKLEGSEIPLQSRIIAIADAYDSMTSDRPYRSAMNREAAAKEIFSEKGRQFDPEIVKVFMEKVYPNLSF